MTHFPYWSPVVRDYSVATVLAYYEDFLNSLSDSNESPLTVSVSLCTHLRSARHGKGCVTLTSSLADDHSTTSCPGTKHCPNCYRYSCNHDRRTCRQTAKAKKKAEGKLFEIRLGFAQVFVGSSSFFIAVLLLCRKRFVSFVVGLPLCFSNGVLGFSILSQFLRCKDKLSY